MSLKGEPKEVEGEDWYAILTSMALESGESGAFPSTFSMILLWCSHRSFLAVAHLEDILADTPDSPRPRIGAKNGVWRTSHKLFSLDLAVGILFMGMSFRSDGFLQWALLWIALAFLSVLEPLYLVLQASIDIGAMDLDQ